MTLRDHSNGAVLGKVAERAHQQRRAIPELAQPVVASMTQQASNLAGRVVMVYVKAAGPTILPRVSSAANRALPALRRKHSVVLGGIDPVLELQQARSTAIFPASERFFLQVGHIANGVVGRIARPWASDNSGSRFAARPVLEELFVVKAFAAMGAGPKNPSTRTQFWSFSSNDASIGYSPISSLLDLARLAGVSVWVKFFNALNLLTDGAEILADLTSRRVGADLSQVPVQAVVSNGFSAPCAGHEASNLDVIHSVAFGTATSMIRRRTVPDRDIDHAAAKRSSFFLMCGSILIRTISDFWFVISNKCTTSGPATQQVIQPKENGLLPLAA